MAASEQCPPSAPEGKKMKRKSERRRSESRKKRCAAPSGSGAAPNSDIYIEITGKGDLRGEPAQLGTELARRCRRTQQDVRARCSALNPQGVCVQVFDFLPPDQL